MRNMRACAIAFVLLLTPVLLRGQALTPEALAKPGPDVWPTYNGDYSGQRHSPLKQINEQTVGKLALAWSRELGTTRGLEATPLIEDGVIYTTGAWSVVYAVDAKSGDIRWTYDSKVPRENALFICCDVVNRGVALYQGKVYVGTLDGRLIALDEHTGAPVWTAATTNNAKQYSITGAPRIAKGLVIIGNAGAENGVRGYISAYEAEKCGETSLTRNFEAFSRSGSTQEKSSSIKGFRTILL